MAGTAGSVALAASWIDARRGVVPPWEERLFTSVNRLPDPLRALWPVMQFGSLASVPVTGAAIAGITGRRSTGATVAAAGLSSWLLAKVVKGAVGRGRPAALLEDVRVREQASGLGFVSGHAAVATAMTTVALRALPPRARPALLATCLWVPLGRMHVGAHLPHDVIGGIGLGLVVGATALVAGTVLAGEGAP